MLAYATANFMALTEYSKMSKLRPLEIKTNSLLRLVFSSPKWYFPYDIKTTSLIRPLLDSLKGGLHISILLYIIKMDHQVMVMDG